MRRLFGSDSPFFRVLQILMEFAAMNLMFMLCGILLVTAGASYAALQDSLFTFLKKGEGCFSAKHFLHVFFQNLKGASALWCPGAAAVCLLAYGAFYWLHVLTGLARVLATGFYFLLLILISGIMQFWLFLLSRGQKADLALVKDCALLSLAKFPAVLFMTACTASPLLLLLLPGALVIRILPAVFLYGFSFPAFFCTMVHGRVLPPHYPALFAEEE